MNKFKKALVAAGTLGPVAVLAEDATTDSAVKQLQDAATAAIGEAKPAVIAILVAMFGIAVAFLAYKLIRKGINKG